MTGMVIAFILPNLKLADSLNFDGLEKKPKNDASKWVRAFWSRSLINTAPIGSV